MLAQAPQEKGSAAFATDFLMGEVSAAVSKTPAASIERVELLIQNQDEKFKAGRLSKPYKGIHDCFGVTIKEEWNEKGIAAPISHLWLENMTKVRYVSANSASTSLSYIIRCIALLEKSHISIHFCHVYQQLSNNQTTML